MPTQSFTNSFSRVWFQPGGPSPSNANQYHGNWKAGSVSWSKGDLTTIREPDPSSYGKFVRTGRFRGEPGDPELPLMARYTFNRSELLRVARADCEHALRVAIGQCEKPQDFARGWQKMLVLEEAAISDYGTEDLGAQGPDETAAVNEDVTFTGTDLYEVTRLTGAEQAGSSITREITGVWVCDSQQCGACGVASDGCQVVLALEGGVSASPGASPRVFYTVNGGQSWASRYVTTLAANQAGGAIICVGSNVMVISADDNALHYIALSDLVNNTGSWSRVTTGFGSTSQAPLAAQSLDATQTWFVGEGGYIYFSDEITVGVEVNDAGNATTENLNSIHFFDDDNGVAVGANNAVVFTTNGGVSWSSVTGPAVGVVLNTVWMVSRATWLVGSAAGSLYYTVNSGATWAEISFSGSGSGQVRDIVFTTPSVGYMAHSTSAPAGRILRTLNGGQSWYVLPEGAGSIPTNDYVGKLAVCDDPNIVFGGGLGGNAVDGFLVKFA